MKSFIFILIIAFVTCSVFAQQNVTKITETEIQQIQESWAQGLIELGRAYSEQKDYKTLAENIVDSLYGYDEGIVLFKPTKAAEKQFRLTENEAVSYFVTGSIHEDHGFALQPWSKVRFENSGIIIDDDSAIAMGNYFFTEAKTGKETKVEYTFGYFRDKKGKLKINLHHSSLPYTPVHN